MDAMRIVEAEDAAIIHPRQMRQDEGKIVSGYLTLSVDPDFFAQNAGSAGAPKLGFVICNFMETASPVHN